MTNDTIAEIEGLALASSPATDCGLVTKDDAAGLADKTDQGQPMLWCAWFGPKDGASITAITGNGPTSEANARFYSRARGAVLELVGEVRRLQVQNAALRAAHERAVLRSQPTTSLTDHLLVVLRRGK